MWQERIAVDPQILAGKPIIKGTRISVELVLDALGKGWSFDDLLTSYSHLTIEDVRACLLYAAELVRTEQVWAISVVNDATARR